MSGKFQMRMPGKWNGNPISSGPAPKNKRASRGRAIEPLG